MTYLQYLILGVLVTAALVAGCSDAPAPAPVVTPTPTPTATPPPTEAPHTDFSLIPGPVGEMPSGKAISVSVERDPIRTDITVRFDGGLGINFISRIDATMYASDGRIEEQSIERPLSMGKSVRFDGTRGIDRVKVAAYYTTGEVVVVSDALYEFKVR